MGYSIVNELAERKIPVIAFSRTKTKLDQLFQGNPYVTALSGDVFNREEVQSAASGADVIFHAVGLPYTEWEEKFVMMVSGIVDAAKTESAKLAVVDNIYAYGRYPDKKVEESDPKNPNTKKGKIRLLAEEVIKKSSVQYIIAHFPDFYGPNAENTILNETFKGVLRNKKAQFIGSPKLLREFIFTPDGAKAIVELALNDSAYRQNWNIPGSDVITGEEIIEIIRRQTGYEKSVSIVSKNMIRFLGFFSPMMREVLEMFYLNEEPVVLSGKKYESQIGTLPRTSYEEGIRQTIQYMQR